MEGPTYVTLSAQLALQSQLDVTANNIANSGTAGYKADRQLFQSMVVPLDTPGREVSYVQDRATYIDRAPGSLETTDNPLDLGIAGDGYLAVQTPQGPQYTRNGKLQISNQGMLVDVNGRPVLGGDNSTIQIPDGARDLKIAGAGTISVRVNGQAQDVGQIGLFRASNAVGLRKSALGLIDGAAGGVAPVQPGDATTRIVQGTIEASTVQPVRELTNMTELSRAYERLQKLIGDDNDRESKMIEQLGRTN